MSVIVIFLIVVMIVERYANRCDTKKVENEGSLMDGGEDRAYFSEGEMFKQGAGGDRSMTIRLKT